MSLKKALISGAAALALIGTAATAAIHVEKDGTGDYLIAPVYIANGAGWKTKIKVVNTNTTSAVIAKVIVREGSLSKELVDFPLFLTPGDVFEAELYAENGSIKIKSTDDSVIVKPDGTPGIDIDLTKNANVLKSAGNVNYDCLNEKMGYVEIIGVAQINEATLKQWYYDANITDDQGNRLTWSAPCPYPKDVLFNNIKVPNSPADLNLSNNFVVDVTNSDLMGQQIIYRYADDDNGKRAMFLNLLAFGDTLTQDDLTNAPDPIYGIGKGILGTDQNIINLSTNPLMYSELMDELAKSHVYVMYEGNEQYKADPFLTIFTRPYWKNWDGIDCDTQMSYAVDEHTTLFRDMSEKSNNCKPCDETSAGDYLSGPTTDCPTHAYEKEVQIVFFHDPEGNGADAWANQYLFSSGGYIDIDLSANNDGTEKWYGVPVIPTTFYAKKVGDLYLNNHLYNQYLKEQKQ